MARHNKHEADEKENNKGLGGFLGGLNSLLEKLTELAEKGEQKWTGPTRADARRVAARVARTSGHPSRTPCIRASCWPPSIHSVGIDSATRVFNPFNQPRELVQGEAISGILS
jgi:hypothetical protein